MSIELTPTISGAPVRRWKRYPAYRDSGVEWIGEVPEGWKTWKVTHGFQRLGSGTTPKSDDSQYYNDIIPWVTTSELRETVITDTKSKLSKKAMKDYSSLRIYPPETLLFAMYGATIGRMGILGIPATVNQACCAFTGSKFLDSKFTFYWLWMRRPILISLSVGGGQPNLSQDDMRKIRIPAPPLPEQRTIAAFLDRETGRIDTLIEKKERQVELLQEKRAALISHAVTKGLDPDVKMKDSGVEWLGEVPEHWPVERLRFHILINPTKSEVHGLARDTTVSFVPMEAVREYGGIRLGQTRPIEEVAAGYTYFRDGDVAVAKITPCFENVKGAVVKGLKNGIGFGTTELHVLRPSFSIDQHFLFYLTISYAFRKLGESEMYGSAGQKRVPEDFIKNLKHPIPILAEQRSIAVFLDHETGHIDVLTTKVYESISKLREYRIALISAAVTGKIDVRNKET